MQKQFVYQQLNHYSRLGEKIPAKFVVDILKSCDRPHNFITNAFVWGDDLIEIVLDYPNRMVYTKREELERGEYKKALTKTFRFDGRCNKSIRTILFGKEYANG